MELQPHCVVNYRIKELYRLWKEQLPYVDIYYKLSYNSTNNVLKIMNDLNVGYSCSSIQEMDDALSLTEPENIIFSNPCKMISHLNYANDKGICLLVFDSECELDKIKKCHPYCSLLLKINTKTNTKTNYLSKKYGCSLEQVSSILVKAKSLNLNVIGFSVNTHCIQYYEALNDCRSATDIANQLSIPITIIDIGDFSSLNKNNFKKNALEVREGMELFENVRFISDVGRFFVESSYTLYFHVICKKMKENRIYYVNHSLTHKTFDNDCLIIRTDVKGELFKSIIYGTTTVMIEIMLPELNVGDKLYIENNYDYKIRQV
uniref:Orn/DAP/Arg decarboxylase 2 N-terminal domain-containing protein n=1 Tax=viral metagenome TaxID=1070528 RepID=A0A6C0EUT8_9ZZZZ